MPPANNPQGNLNLFLFEVGVLTREPLTGTTFATTLGLHPVVVNPSSISRRIIGRSTVEKTAGAFWVARGGLGPESWTFQGTFGKMSRGIGIYIGDGEVRAKRFLNEVVRLPEAVTREDAAAAYDLLTGTPTVGAAAGIFDPETQVFYVNFYNLWDDVAYSVKVDSYSYERSQGRGAAAGLIWYNFAFSEAGPLIQGTPVSAVVLALFKAAVLLDGFADVIDSYNPQAIVDALAAIPAMLLSLVEDNLNSLQESFASFQALTSGNAGLSTSTLANVQGFFGTAAKLNAALGDVYGYALALKGAWFAPDEGEPDWAKAVDEGSNRGLRAEAAVRDIEVLRDVLSQLQIIGAFYGQEPGAFRAWVENAGYAGRAGPTLGRGGRRIVVGRLDTLYSLSERWAVSPEALLAANALAPDELQPGLEILIPVERTFGSLAISGLPTLDSHQGELALGSDLDLTFEVDSEGDLQVVSGGECLIQGLASDLTNLYDLLISDFDLLPAAAVDRWVQRRVGQAMRADPRVATVRQIEVDPDGDAGLTVNVTVTAITGLDVEV